MKKLILLCLLLSAPITANAVIIKLDGCVVKKVILETNEKGKIVIKRVKLKDKSCAITIEKEEEIEITSIK